MKMKDLLVLLGFLKVVTGLFLFVDGIFLHLISFKYPDQIAFLDPYVNHWLIGVVFIILGAYAMKVGSK